VARTATGNGCPSCSGKQSSVTNNRARHHLAAELDPDLAERRERIILTGDVPSPINPPSGCRFHPRCRYMTDVCTQIEPPLTDYGGHLAACHHPLNVSSEDALRAEAAANTPVSAPEEATPTEPAGRRSQPIPTDTPQ